MEKLKVAWICHFSNKEVRTHLPLSKRYLYNFLKIYFGDKTRAEYSDFASWITNLINEFERFEDIELHIISPHRGLVNFTYTFELKGITFHFFNPELPLLLSRIVNKLFLNRRKEFWLNRYFVKSFLRRIKPGIVNLIGTENPYYSITVLDIKDIPIFVSVQTVFTNPNRKSLSGEFNSVKWNLELKIHQKEKYFGCGGRLYRDLILNNNPNAIIFKNFFPIQKPVRVLNVPKVYDFIFFASAVTKKKGIEDAIEALALVKKERSNVTLNVVGKCAPDYKNILKNKIASLELFENITFNDYFPVHADMYQHIKRSRFALLPIKMDVIPGTVIEAILLDLPVATYKTTGTPYLNKDGENILLADIGDIGKLAENMLKLLNSSELAEKLSKDAKAFVEQEFDNTNSAKRLVKNYRAVIDHYYHNIQIPEELLFNTEEFPLY